MLIDYWWVAPLLLPLAALSGWWAASRAYGDGAPSKAKYDLPSAYFKGLNYLLNEQPDKAIEVFVKVLEVDTETVETHLAVGNLFRRRGEVERATRIHQNLIARPNLEPPQRSQALFELAQDYLKAGLFDRAENLLLELAEVHQHSEQALLGLIHIYEQEKEWDNAIAVSRKLVRATGRRLDHVIAQYDCELAEQAEREQDMDAASALARRALNADRRCVRANLLLGRIQARSGNHKEAIRIWKRIGEQDAQYLVEVVGPVTESYQVLGDDDGLHDFFNTALKRHGGVALMLGLTSIIEKRSGAQEAQRFLVDWLRKHPSVHGLYRLIELNLVHASDTARRDLELLRGMIGRLLEQQQGYVCEQCGFSGKQLHWQCPSCKGWTTVRPVATAHAN